MPPGLCLTRKASLTPPHTWIQLLSPVQKPLQPPGPVGTAFPFLAWPTRWGLPSESPRLSRRAGLPVVAEHGSPTSACRHSRPCPTSPLSTRCPPAPILPGRGWALLRVAGESREQGLESICSLSKCVAVCTCVCVSGCGGDRHLHASRAASPQSGASKRSGYSLRSVLRDWGVLGCPPDALPKARGDARPSA